MSGFWSRPTRAPRELPEYLDTPAGLLAADGTHYRTTEPLLREYAGPVVEAVVLVRLLRQAGVWLRSPRTVGVLFLPALLAVMPWALALGVAVLLFALWAAVAPGVASPRVARALAVLGSAGLQGAVYVASLSAFALSGQTAAVWAGVAGFVAFRLGAVEAALRPVLGPIWASLYPLPVADQTLRSLLVRHALRRGERLAGMAEIEDRVRSFWRREKE